MLSSVAPLGERGRSNRWIVTVVAYIRRTSIVVGALLGGVLGAAGSLLRGPRCHAGRAGGRSHSPGSSSSSPDGFRCRRTIARSTNGGSTNTAAGSMASAMGSSSASRGHHRHQRHDVPHVRRRVPLSLGPRRPGHRPHVRPRSGAPGPAHRAGPQSRRPAWAAASQRPMGQRRPPARARWAGVHARGGNPCDDGDLMKLQAHGIEADLLPGWEGRISVRRAR